jgi:hypothetical protein
MLVSQLIEELGKFPANMEVAISTPDDPEFSVQPLEMVEQITVDQLDGPGGAVLAKVETVVLRDITDPDNV